MDGHDAFGISKGLKPRHIKAMEKYTQDYIDSKGQLSGRYEQSRMNTHRVMAAVAGNKAQKYPKWARDPLVNNGKRNRAEGRKLERVRSRKYRKNTRMGLFRTEVGERVK